MRRITFWAFWGGGVWAERLDYLSGNLSGGQKQRVAIARALVSNPDSHLSRRADGSRSTRPAAWRRCACSSTSALRGSTTVMVTHDPRILDLADRVVTLEDGRIVEDRAGSRARQMNSCRATERRAPANRSLARPFLDIEEINRWNVYAPESRITASLLNMSAMAAPCGNDSLAGRLAEQVSSATLMLALVWPRTRHPRRPPRVCVWAAVRKPCCARPATGRVLS